MESELRIIRVNKHPDHDKITWFRLFVGEELITSFRIPDDRADMVEGAILRRATQGACEGWISVDDNLPGDNEEVVGRLSPNGRLIFVCYRKDSRQWFTRWGWIGTSVAYWVPLPDMPAAPAKKEEGC